VTAEELKAAGDHRDGRYAAHTTDRRPAARGYSRPIAVADKWLLSDVPQRLSLSGLPCSPPEKL